MKPGNRSWVPRFSVFVCLFLFEDNQSLQMDAEKNEFLKLMPGLCNTKASKSRNNETKSRAETAHAHYPVAGVVL